MGPMSCADAVEGGGRDGPDRLASHPVPPSGSRAGGSTSVIRPHFPYRLRSHVERPGQSPIRYVRAPGRSTSPRRPRVPTSPGSGCPACAPRSVVSRPSACGQIIKRQSNPALRHERRAGRKARAGVRKRHTGSASPPHGRDSRRGVSGSGLGTPAGRRLPGSAISTPAGPRSSAAAIRFRARLANRTNPTRPAVDRALAGFRRRPPASRAGPGTAAGSRAPPWRTAGAASPAASVPGAVLVRVRQSKTNQDGSSTDVRMVVKNGPGRRPSGAGRAGARPGHAPDSDHRADGRAAPAGCSRRRRGRAPTDRPLGTGRVASELTARGAADLSNSHSMRSIRLSGPLRGGVRKAPRSTGAHNILYGPLFRPLETLDFSPLGLYPGDMPKTLTIRVDPETVDRLKRLSETCGGISIAELVRTFSHGNVADLLRIGLAQAKAQAETRAVQAVQVDSEAKP